MTGTWAYPHQHEQRELESNYKIWCVATAHQTLIHVQPPLGIMSLSRMPPIQIPNPGVISASQSCQQNWYAGIRLSINRAPDKLGAIFHPANHGMFFQLSFCSKKMRWAYDRSRVVWMRAWKVYNKNDLKIDGKFIHGKLLRGLNVVLHACHKLAWFPFAFFSSFMTHWWFECDVNKYSEFFQDNSNHNRRTPLIFIVCFLFSYPAKVLCSHLLLNKTKTTSFEWRRVLWVYHILNVQYMYDLSLLRFTCRFEFKSNIIKA